MFAQSAYKVCFAHTFVSPKVTKLRSASFLQLGNHGDSFAVRPHNKIRESRLFFREKIQRKLTPYLFLLVFLGFNQIVNLHQSVCVLFGF